MGANWQNRTLFHGDNLKFLRAMNSESVDLIATDPPFNKGRDFHATPDSLAAGAKFQDRWSWETDVHQDWIDQLKDDHPRLMEAIESARYAHSDGMGAYLCFMSVRLLEMRRVLKPTGSIYLHCDPTASHYLKAAMDAVFGYRNFRNEITWQRTITRKGNLTRGLARDADIILRYSKSNFFVWNAESVTIPYDLNNLDDKTKQQYCNVDKDGRLYQLTAITAPIQNPKSKLTYEVMGVIRTWRWRKERMEREIANGRVVQTKPGNVPRQIRYLDEQKGRSLNCIWIDIPALHSQAKERTGYATQKPLELYGRLIKASSNEGDVVLDPFAGCATTLVAAERLNRQWVGMDLWDDCKKVILKRLQREGLIQDGDNPDGHLFPKDIVFTDQLPVRTDEKEEAAPFLRVKERVKEPEGKRWSRKQMYDYLIEQHGCKCQGCDRTFDDPRFLELDHNIPRSDGGINHITNRVLLCGPCNKIKSNIYTLSGLRRQCKKIGFMAKK